MKIILDPKELCYVVEPEHIQITVAANWDIDGGEDTVQPFGSMLVVNCPEEVHLAIEGLLFELSKMNKENFK